MDKKFADILSYISIQKNQMKSQIHPTKFSKVYKCMKDISPNIIS